MYFSCGTQGCDVLGNHCPAWPVLVKFVTVAKCAVAPLLPLSITSLSRLTGHKSLSIIHGVYAGFSTIKGQPADYGKFYIKFIPLPLARAFKGNKGLVICFLPSMFEQELIKFFLQCRMTTSSAVADLGKRLLEASRKGNAEEVRQLMATGAPITTDWVCGYCKLYLVFFYCSILNKLLDM